MDCRELARADQIRAYLREADKPVPAPFVWYSVGMASGGWSYPATLELLDELRLLGLVSIRGIACCAHHAYWMLPEDR